MAKETIITQNQKDFLRKNAQNNTVTSLCNLTLLSYGIVHGYLTKNNIDFVRTKPLENKAIDFEENGFFSSEKYAQYTWTL